MLFDTHTHSYFPELMERQDEIIEKMIQNNVTFATQIGCDIKTSQQAIDLAQKYKHYYATVWYHPTEGQTLERSMIPQIKKDLEELLVHNREHIVAIGEIGFDYYHLDHEKMDEQKETQRILFFTMTELAMKYNLPVVIHTREARTDTIRYIQESGIRKAIIHCFSEDYEFAKELMKYSDEIYFSFSGILTYKKSLGIQEAAKLLPLEKILIETDAPFLSPQIVRWTINESANVRHILDVLQNLRDENHAKIEEVIYENSLRVYGLQ